MLCNACSLRSRCTTSIHGRLVSFYKGSYFIDAEALVHSEKQKKLLKAQQIIVEGVIGEEKNLHLLNRCHYCSLRRFRIQLVVTAAAINLKRLLKTTGQRLKTPTVVMDILFQQLFSLITLRYDLQTSISNTVKTFKNTSTNLVRIRY